MTDKAAAARPESVVVKFPITEVDELGHTVDRLAETRRGLITTRKIFDYNGHLATFELSIDTNTFEVPPTFTFEIGPNGPRLYIHGTAGELAKIIEIMDDGSIRIETHE